MTIPRLSARDIMPDALREGIAALGNFDGFHLGHQAVAGEAIAQAKAAGKPAIIATFDPHPVRYFAPAAAPFRLTTLDQRQRLFEAAGADAMLVFEFDAELAGTTAEDFIGKLLVERLGLSGRCHWRGLHLWQRQGRQHRHTERIRGHVRTFKHSHRPGLRCRRSDLLQPHP